jgi:hypothetical protein
MAWSCHQMGFIPLFPSFLIRSSFLKRSSRYDEGAGYCSG